MKIECIYELNSCFAKSGIISQDVLDSKVSVAHIRSGNPIKSTSRSLSGSTKTDFRDWNLSITRSFDDPLRLGSVNVHAQSPSPLSFFPHRLGDIWEYIDPFNPDEYEQNVITVDSLGVGGEYYLETTLFGSMRVYTSGFCFWPQSLVNSPKELINPFTQY